MPKFRLIVGCCLLLICFSSCRPRGVLSRSEMTDVLYDLHLAEAAVGPEAGPIPNTWTKGMPPEYFRDLAYNSVFKKHKINQETFYASVAWYSTHLRLYSKIYDDLHFRFTNWEKAINEGQFLPVKAIKASDLDTAKVRALFTYALFRADTVCGKPLYLAPDPLSSHSRWYAHQWLYALPKDTAKLELVPPIPVLKITGLGADSLKVLADSLAKKAKLPPPLSKQNLQKEVLAPGARKLPTPYYREAKKDDQIRMRFKPRAREQLEMERKLAAEKKAALKAAQQKAASQK
jgi:hypothetical protein